MEALMKRQEQNEISVLNFVANHNKTAKAKRTKGYIKGRIDLLNRYFNTFQQTHDDIMALADSSNNDDTYFTDDCYSKVECEYAEALGILYDELETLTPSVSHSSIPVSASVASAASAAPAASAASTTPAPAGAFATHFAMPQISLPKFGGDILEWPSFKDLFTALAIRNQHLSNVQRLQYLKTNLTGEAAHLLRDVLITDANFNIAWESLTKHYENSRILINTYLRAIMNAPKISRESCSDLTVLLSTMTQSVRALSNLERPTNTWDDWLVYVTVHKFDPTTRKDWETAVSAREELPTFKTLTDFMTCRIRTLTAIQYDGPTKPTSTENKPCRNTVKSHHSDTNSNTSSNSNNKCPCCSHKHPLSMCFAFRKKSLSDRRALAIKEKLCLNCFSRGHTTGQCPSTNNCRTCDQRHHTMVHIGETSSATVNESTTSTPIPSTSQSVGSHVARQLSCRNVLLATAIVNVRSSNDNVIPLKALLDQGSHASFITQSAVQLLHLRQFKINISVHGISGSSAGSAKSMVTLNFQSRYNSSEIFSTEALVLSKLTDQLPERTMQPLELPFIRDIQLADPQYYCTSKIDIILGADIYASLLRDGIRSGSQPSPIAQNTVLGWILSGPLPIPSQSSVFAHHSRIDFDFDRTLRKFWEVEEADVPHVLDADDQACETHFANTPRRNADGRYMVRLPIKPDDTFSNFGDTRKAAVCRLFQLERRFSHDQDLKQQYGDFMAKYEALGHMRQIHLASDDYDGYFIPHHYVIKPSSTSTKLRVVFDASRPGPTGFSLNDRLYVGPKLQRDLSSIILRWRMHAIVIITDIEKMFRQILVHPADTKFQRIVWRDSVDERIKNFDLQTVTYGTSCAPYLAIRTLHQLAADEAHQFPLASKALINDVLALVDDVLTGASDVDSCIALQSQLISMLQSAGFILKKWSSNNTQLLNHLPEDFRESKSFVLVDDTSIKALGVHWTPLTDHFGFKVSLGPAQIPTSKRSLLSDVSKLYDPLGWVSPVIVTGKILFQRLWLLGSTWDDDLPPELQQRWNHYRADLQCLERVQLPRFIDTTNDVVSIELHGFSDASIVAYAAVIYLRVTRPDGSIIVHLLTAKTKVAPIRQVSLPRLELLGATLLSRLMQKIRTDMNLSTVRTYGWTDSTIVLAWIRSPASRWKVFVANRVSTIQTDASIDVWNHVVSASNPADCGSRGLMPTELLSHPLWWHGPPWLQNDSEFWITSSSVDLTTTLEERACVAANVAGPSRSEFADIICKYSSLHKLIRIFAFCRRFIYNARTRNRHNRNIAALTTAELASAHTTCVRIVQNLSFHREISNLERKLAIDNKSNILKYSPFIDDVGVLRVGGRLHHSSLGFTTKHPIILPRDGHFTQLVIAGAHLVMLHGGAQLTLNHLREKYWIIDGRNKVRQFIKRCVTCFRYAAKPPTQLMGQLPSHRVTPARAFLHTGVDYAGPIDVRTAKGRGNKTHKAYIAIFVCFATRAVHIELVSDQTSQAFLAAFNRFVSRRGVCSDLYSDCGTNFVGAKSLLLADMVAAKTDHRDIVEQLSKCGTQWHLIPPGAPHFGGLWEAAVKSSKHHLKRVIGQTTLTFEEMYTLLCQIEACLNSRPIYPLSDDPDDMSALTPGHFLIGSAICSVPAPNIMGVKVNRLTRWQLVQQMQQHFWDRWSSEYLHILQQRTKWAITHVNIKIGDMVLLKDERYPPCSWPLGRVIDTHPGTDGLTRVVTVKYKSNVLKRPISKVCALPINDNVSNNLADNGKVAGYV